MNAPVTFPSTLSSGVSVAVRPVTSGVISYTDVYTGSLVLNQPNTGLSSQSIALIPNSFIWKGTSNLVLSFEYWGPVNTGGTYQLYCEQGLGVKTFYATCNNAATMATAVALYIP